MSQRCRFFEANVSEMHEYLRMKEESLPVYHSQSPQLASRRYLVDWLAILADKFDICSVSRHLAVALLDYFMDRFSICERQVKLVVIGCLLIACKLEEQEINIPKSNALNAYVPDSGYQPKDFLCVELTILQALAWQVQLPTAAHMLEYYVCCAVSETDHHCGQPLQKHADLARQYLVKYTSYFLEVSLQDEFYRRYKPSLVACACIAASRLCLGIAPAWTPALIHTTGYHWLDMHAVIGKMLVTHQTDSQESGSGITTPSPHTLPTTPVVSCETPSLLSPDVSDQGYHSLTHTPSSPTSPPRGGAAIIATARQ